MAISDKARELTDRIYQAYASETGWLFLIPPSEKEAVVLVVQIVMDMLEEEQEDGN